MSKFNLSAKIDSFKNSKTSKFIFTNPFIISLIIFLIIVILLLIVYNKHLELKTQWKRFLIYIFIILGIVTGVMYLHKIVNDKKSELVLDTKLGNDDEIETLDNIVNNIENIDSNVNTNTAESTPININNIGKENVDVVPNNN